MNFGFSRFSTEQEPVRPVRRWHDCVSIPKGLRPKAQGCEERATLGNRRDVILNPNGVVALLSAGPNVTTPSGLKITARISRNGGRSLAERSLSPSDGGRVAGGRVRGPSGRPRWRLEPRTSRR